jgi:hypothetical protein
VPDVLNAVAFVSSIQVPFLFHSIHSDSPMGLTWRLRRRGNCTLGGSGASRIRKNNPDLEDIFRIPVAQGLESQSCSSQN